MQHYTTIEQSKKLVELGLSTDTADMQYLKLIRENDIVYIPELLLNDDECDIPCWSLGTLMELLRPYNDCNKLDIFSNRSQKWQITISYYDIIWKEHKEININLLEAAYNVVVWLLENGYIKKEK